MPKEWKERAKHIRDKNPDMPEGMEWALATEQYKKKHGHPPRRHHKKKSEVIIQLLRLADQLDRKGLVVEADLIDKAWFDPSVMNHSINHPSSHVPGFKVPTEKNYCFNCSAPILTVETKCPVCQYEPTKEDTAI